MYISELTEGTIVTIDVAGDRGSIRLESEVFSLEESDADYVNRGAQKAGLSHFVAVQTIMDNNHPINFISAKVRCNVTALQDNKPYSWQNVKILRVTLPKAGDCHLIFCAANVKTFNRRNQYRLFLGCEAQCRLGDSPVPRNIILKDISEGGAGFIIDDEFEVEIGMKVRIQFFEMVNGKPILYTINGKIVRYLSMNNNRLFIGCKATDNGEALKNFIYSKQRQSLSSGAGKGKTKEELDKQAENASLVRDMYREMTKNEE